MARKKKKPKIKNQNGKSYLEIEAPKARGIMPPPSKKFENKKKKANKKACRGKLNTRDFFWSK